MMQLRSALVLATTTFLEAIRNRILLVALAFAVALVGLSVAVAAVSIGERARLIVDVGLAAASAMGSLIAISLTIASFGREIAQHTAFPVLVRPISRGAFVLGKYLGVLATMISVVGLMLAATAAAVWLYGDTLPAAFSWCFVLSFIEMAVVTAVALLFSCVSSPVLAATFSVGMLIAGNLTADIAALAAKAAATAPAVGWLLYATHEIVPDLQALSLRTQAANNLAVPPAFVGYGALYGLAYTCVMVGLAMLFFTRRRTI